LLTGAPKLCGQSDEGCAETRFPASGVSNFGVGRGAKIGPEKQFSSQGAYSPEGPPTIIPKKKRQLGGHGRPGGLQFAGGGRKEAKKEKGEKKRKKGPPPRQFLIVLPGRSGAEGMKAR